jgi:tRNA(Ile2) C34 agmatinyltransferase TiaS
MRIHIGFDDTDVAGAAIGTGRLARMFGAHLPEGARLWGVLRHQLLVDPRIPYTSHNSPACVVVETEEADLEARLIDAAVAHVAKYASPGSDPGVCVFSGGTDGGETIDFGLSCTHSIETQARATATAVRAGAKLLGLGGTNDGIIGALAAVGLTLYGWSGRFLEYGDLRALKDPSTAGRLRAAGIEPLCLDPGSRRLADAEEIHFDGWLSPRLLGGVAVAPVTATERGYRALGKKPRDAEIAE